MKKSIPVSNSFCPQTLFVYGTYNSDGKPDFGLFCWVSYYWGETLGVMAAICEDKRTRDNIRANGVFSMGLVTEELLSLADYFGGKSGYDADKLDIPAGIEKGRILHVPVLEQCPWTFELEVDKTFRDNGADIYLCKIRNVLADEALCDETAAAEEKLSILRPARTVGGTYFSWDGRALGKWGEPRNQL
ncbi:MAG: flavin reductase [Oscillospiraceae bacterium]|jgi:flavin reductase (DIM6/NTAB) family NADH-FMN oxidoreductase RutF|nr:flavin reductase [Oscillospiraceae bacterium]